MPEIAALLLCGSFPTFPRFYKYLRYELREKSGYSNTGYSKTGSSRQVNIVGSEMADLSQEGKSATGTAV
jgi:hypothetical protein